MTEPFSLLARRIFDGERFHEGSGLVIRAGLVEEIVAEQELPSAAIDTGAELLAPGFVDLQVNGGGGVMLNDRPELAPIRSICLAHARFGTTALLPTLITDTPETTAAAIAAGIEAARSGVPGFLGLHLEGPHLSRSRKGAHDPALIRPMTDRDRDALIAAREGLPVLLTTVAPESATPEQIAALAGAGTIVSLGHSDATFAVAAKAAAAGATMVTHLFNAMSQIGNREPGLVGAALDDPLLWAGLIADGIHVHPAAIGLALRAKRGPARIFLVTDAMATIGTDMSSFTLNGRTVFRREGRLTLEDGTLAGADLDMASAVRFVHREIGVELGEALRMASLYPAQAVGQAPRLGRLCPGSVANVVALGSQLSVEGVWIAGDKLSLGAA